MRSVLRFRSGFLSSVVLYYTSGTYPYRQCSNCFYQYIDH